MLDSKQEKVLFAVLREYIETAEPVGFTIDDGGELHTLLRRCIGHFQQAGSCSPD